jgi:alpha-1,3-glucosyltransferase
MLDVANLGYASNATVLFQRLTVAASSLVLVGAMLRATRDSGDAPRGLTAFVLVVCNAGLLMVDAIHFQYNAVLLGACVFVWLLGSGLAREPRVFPPSPL